MAHSPKKGRPASVTLVQTPAPVIETPAVEAPAVFETPAPEATQAFAEASTEVSSLALQAAEPSAPALELPQAPPVVESPAVAAIDAAIEAAHAPVAAPHSSPAPAAAFTDNVRSLFEKGLTQTKARLDDAKTAAQETAAAVEASYGAVHSGVAAFNAKAMEALTSGAHAQFDHFVSLASAKSLSELLTLQGEFARKRFEEATSQAKQMTELARKVADESVAPIKAQVVKAFKQAV